MLDCIQTDTTLSRYDMWQDQHYCSLPHRLCIQSLQDSCNLHYNLDRCCWELRSQRNYLQHQHIVLATCQIQLRRQCQVQQLLFSS